MAKQIEITIHPDGTSTVDAVGFQGVGCSAATEAFELALAGPGNDNKDDRKKPEFYAASATNTHQVRG